MKISVLVARLRRAHALMTVRQAGPEVMANPAGVISVPKVKRSQVVAYKPVNDYRLRESQL